MAVIYKSILFFIVAFPIFATPNLEQNLDVTSSVYKDLQKLKFLKPEEYLKSIDSYRGKVELFIEHKKKVCQGVFSSLVLEAGKTEKTIEPAKKFKLSKEERKLCYREMKAIEMTLVNNLFLARKNFLIYLHNKQLKNLEKSREEVLIQLQKSFNREI